MAVDEQPDAKRPRTGGGQEGQTTTGVSDFGFAPKPVPEGLYVAGAKGHVINEAASCGAVTAEHLKRYADDGYLVVRSVLAEEEIERTLAAIEDLCNEKNEAYNAACEQTNRDKPNMAFGTCEPTRQFEAAAAGVPKGQRGHLVRKLQNYHDAEPRIDVHKRSDFDALVSSLACPSGSSCGTDIFQSLALLKPPRVGREKPWHQDHSYFNVPLEPSACGAPTTVVGVWIALDPATAENGCMHVLPGGHKAGARPHFMVRDWQLCDTEVLEKGSQILRVELAPGDGLFFSSLLPHGTSANESTLSRRAIQYHFVARESGRTTDEFRTDTFGGAGLGLAC